MHSVAGIAQASGVNDDEAQLALDLADVLTANETRNAERTSYYEGEEGLRNIGIAIPEELCDLRMSCSWPAKAVDALADRSVYDGVSFRCGEDLSGVGAAMDAARVAVKYDKAKRTQLVHGCSFWTVTRGSSPLMPVAIRQHSARGASAIWDDEAERIAAGLVVAAYDRRPGRERRPIRANLYTSTHVLRFACDDEGMWHLADRLPHSMGRPMMEAMTYAPTTDKPLGTSRITRAVMSITDCAIRESLRTEVHAELFTTPQKYLIGASKKQLEEITSYDAMFGAIFGLGVNEEGDKPTFGQLSQASMQPHTDYMRSLAAQFSGATDVPISTLGVVHDNPSSAEAIHAAETPLVIAAEVMNKANQASMECVARMAAAVLLGKPLDDLTEDEAGIVVSFRRPDRPSVASQSDAIMKQASTPGLEWIGSSDVALEELGYTESQRVRMLSEKRRAETSARVGRAMELAVQRRGGVTSDADASATPAR